MKPSRLFDCIAHQLSHFPKEDMLAAKTPEGEWKRYTTSEVKSMVEQMAGALLQSGIGAGDGSVEGRDKIAVISSNRPEWLILDLAVQMTGAVLVPLYPTLAETELQFVLQDAAVKLVFTGDKALYEKVDRVRGTLPQLKAVFTFDDVNGAQHWSEWIGGSTAGVAEAAAKVQPHDLATIIYTSGTTGTPKGVMLSHHNILSNVLSCEPIFRDFCNEKDRALSFLPLNHIFEKTASYIYLFNGVSIYYAQSLETIGDNLKEVQPSVFTTVPRLLEKVYDKIMAKGLELSGIKRKLFDWAVELGNQYDIHAKHSLSYRIQLALANKLIFKKWREALGGNVKAIITGAAACQVRLLRVFTAGQMNILEGYGLTETSPVIAVNRYAASERKFGTVGRVIDGVEVKIAADGEICCKGDNVMMGYYKRPDLTAEVMDAEGYFHTGDIGKLEEGGFLKITDRKKEIFKTSGGKYVAPQPIENKMKENKFIEQMIVVGADRKFAAALIVPSFENLRLWAAEHQVKGDTVTELLQQPAVTELYQKIIDEYNPLFNPVEQIKKFHLLSAEWTIDGGELTPTLKLRRKIIMEKYSKEVEELYA